MDFHKFTTKDKRKSRYVCRLGKLWLILNPHNESVSKFSDYGEDLSLKISPIRDLTSEEDLIKLNGWSTTEKAPLTQEERDLLDEIIENMAEEFLESMQDFEPSDFLNKPLLS